MQYAYYSRSRDAREGHILILTPDGIKRATEIRITESTSFNDAELVGVYEDGGVVVVKSKPVTLDGLNVVGEGHEEFSEVWKKIISTRRGVMGIDNLSRGRSYRMLRFGEEVIVATEVVDADYVPHHYGTQQCYSCVFYSNDGVCSLEVGQICHKFGEIMEFGELPEQIKEVFRTSAGYKEQSEVAAQN